MKMDSFEVNAAKISHLNFSSGSQSNIAGKKGLQDTHVKNETYQIELIKRHETSHGYMKSRCKSRMKTEYGSTDPE
jgi:hypothetical protein